MQARALVSRMALLGLVTLALVAVRDGSPSAKGEERAADPAPDRVMDPPAYDEFLVIPLRVHVLSATDLPEVDCLLSDADVRRIVGKVNGIWHKAGIHWGLETPVREPAARQARFRLARDLVGKDDLRLFPLLLPEASRDFDGLHVYYLHAFPVNGVYMGDDYAIVQETARLREVEGGIDEPIPRVTAHELGHALGLPHRQARTNLLASGTTGTGLNAEEVASRPRVGPRDQGRRHRRRASPGGGGLVEGRRPPPGAPALDLAGRDPRRGGRRGPTPPRRTRGAGRLRIRPTTQAGPRRDDRPVLRRGPRSDTQEGRASPLRERAEVTDGTAPHVDARTDPPVARAQHDQDRHAGGRRARRAADRAGGPDRAGGRADAEPRRAGGGGDRRAEPPRRAGITPGSGPGHLGLFGYDPLVHDIGRGVLEALGIGVEVGPHDVAIRGNFCTIDREGLVLDRRAGRIPTETCVRLVEKLRAGVRIEGVETLIEPVREYRLVIRFRGEGLGDNVADTDPLTPGLPTLVPVAGDPGSEKTARVAAEFLRQARHILKDEHPGQLPDAPRVRQLPQDRHDGGRLRPQVRSRSPSTRCTAAWRDWSA